MNEQAEGDGQHRANNYTSEQLTEYLDQIDSADDELDSLLGSYRNDCKGPRGRIKNALVLAKEDGINLNAFREVLAAHRAKRKQEKRIDALEDDDRDAFTRMSEALGEFGDTPLGAAALDRARPKSDALDSLHQS